MPNSFNKNLNADDMIKFRSMKRQKLAKRRGRKSSDTFKKGDPVRIQNPKTNKWDIKGIIQEIRL